MFKTKALNQRMTNSCTVYAVYTCAKAYVEHKLKKEIKPSIESFIELQKKDKVFNDTVGGSLGAAVKGIVKHGFIYKDGVYSFGGYIYFGYEDIDKYINDYPIITNIKLKAFQNTAKTGKVDLKEVNGSMHACVIIGEDNNNYIGITSWGEKWGKYKDGTFLIPKKDISKLISFYILTKKKEMINSPLQDTATFTSAWIRIKPYVTQRFGLDPSKYSKYGMKGHNGIDFRAKVGTKLFAPIDGVCTIKKDTVGYGWHVRIRNATKCCEVVIGHMSRLDVVNGQYVSVGDIIGLSGNTGDSTGPHVHLGYRMIKYDASKHVDNWSVLNYKNGFFGALNIDNNIICWKGTLFNNNL